MKALRDIVDCISTDSTLCRSISRIQLLLPPVLLCWWTRRGSCSQNVFARHRLMCRLGLFGVSCGAARRAMRWRRSLVGPLRYSAAFCESVCRAASKECGNRRTEERRRRCWRTVGGTVGFLVQIYPCNLCSSALHLQPLPPWAVLRWRLRCDRFP